MKTKKLFALMLVLAIALANMSLFAFAEESAAPSTEPEVQVETPEPVPTETETPPQTQQPETEESETPEPSEAAETETPAPSSGISTPLPDTTATTAPAADATSEIVIPGSTASLPEETLTPTEEPFVSAYAYIPAGTTLYSDRGRTEKLGVLGSACVMAAREAAVYESGSLYEVYFDTEETRDTGAPERAYFYASSLERPGRAETEAYIAAHASYHTVEGVRVFMADFQYDSQSDEALEAEEMPLPTEAPLATEEPLPTEAPLATAEPLPTEEPLSTEAPLATEEPLPTEAPLATVEPLPTEAPLATEEPLPAEEPLPTEQPERSVHVTVSRDTEELQLGSVVTLTASLEGYEDVNYTCCWQYAAADRDGNIVGEWQDAQSGTLEMSYELTAENLLTAWRMSVTIVE